jgi:hypothetical protein
MKERSPLFLFDSTIVEADQPLPSGFFSVGAVLGVPAGTSLGFAGAVVVAAPPAGTVLLPSV